MALLKFMMNIPLQFNTSTDIENQIINATVIGQATPQEIVDMYKELTALANKFHYTKLLVNISAVEIAYSSSQVLKVLNKLESILSSYQVARVACLANYKNDLIESFSENKSLNIKNFSDEESARNWLCKANIDSPKEAIAV